MWGKLGENPFRTQTQFISDLQDLYRFPATPGIEVATLLFVGYSVFWILWRHAEGSHAPTLRHTNEVIASYVTTGTRMHLYTYLDTAEMRAVHRHSVIYIQTRDGAALVKTGVCLGDMTSELKPREYISEFVSGGPKNYAYQTHNTETGAEATVCIDQGLYGLPYCVKSFPSTILCKY